MTSTAKLFQNGQSQAIRLPKEYRFEHQQEVIIKKIDGAILIFPKNDKSVWEKMFDTLDNFSSDFLAQRTQPTQEREELF